MNPNQPSLSLQFNIEDERDDNQLSNDANLASVPSLCGVPLKYISLVTLAVQNSLLSIVMHYSRVSTPVEQQYSSATAVLLNELLKGFISFIIALSRVEPNSPTSGSGTPTFGPWERLKKLGYQVFCVDCWRLSIPAILYVIQNNLQYVAASNLDVATFQVAYQLKILTTAAFSVGLLRKKLSGTQWIALLALALGVGIVQIQAGSPGGGAHSHALHPTKGFIAVIAACCTSGLAGVYFEMVLKNSQTDLWVRNLQLSLFSLLPAILPIVYTHTDGHVVGSSAWFATIFHGFGFWAWTTVIVQVLGGLITALVIKYADNILKGFATSLSIIISFLASMVLFNFQMNITFALGSSCVLVATWLYNVQPKSTVRWSPWSWNRVNEKEIIKSPVVDYHIIPRTPTVLFTTAHTNV